MEFTYLDVTVSVISKKILGIKEGDNLKTVMFYPSFDKKPNYGILKYLFEFSMKVASDLKKNYGFVADHIVLTRAIFVGSLFQFKEQGAKVRISKNLSSVSFEDTDRSMVISYNYHTGKIFFKEYLSTHEDF